MTKLRDREFFVNRQKPRQAMKIVARPGLLEWSTTVAFRCGRRLRKDDVCVSADIQIDPIIRSDNIAPGNRLEALKGDRKGFHSIRINDQWRVELRWKRGQALDGQVVDYHCIRSA